MDALSAPSPGRLFGLGVGPGDPELITLKALRLLQAAHVVAYFAARRKTGNAIASVEEYLRPGQAQLKLVYPVTTEKLPPPFCYETALRQFYDDSAHSIRTELEAGRDVAVICEGDPFFFGSFMYLHDRLAGKFATEVVPGVCSVVAAAAVAGTPLMYRNQSLTVLSGVLDADDLRARIGGAEAVAIMKLGGNFAKVRAVIRELGQEDRAVYVERATMGQQRVMRLGDVDAAVVPYFAMVLVPGDCWGATRPPA